VAPSTVVAIIQARMGSSRLPGKVMLALCGHSVLAQVITRVSAAKGIDTVVVATSTNPEDDVIAAEAVRYRATVFRGSAEDVLLRYYGAALSAGADVVVRITSDCPLLDPEVLSAMLARFRDRAAAARPLDYLSNGLVRSFPRGLDVEVFSFAALARCHAQATLPYEREHVTPYIYGHPELFAIDAYTATPDRSAYRWTLDTPGDWALIEAIYRSLGDGCTIFSTASVLALLEARPDLVALNAHVSQKAPAGGAP
jgi:spore coat polysaccharide biosynthesis protein SpsF